MKLLPLLLALANLCVMSTVEAAGFKAGVAVRTVTPSPLLPVSGGMGPSSKASEKKGDLTVRALALGNTQTQLVIVSSDFLGFPAALGDKVRAQVMWIPSEHILIGASHTHSAPDCYGFPDGKGGTDADLEYLNFVCDQMAGAIHSALASMRPARLRINTGEARGKIAYNAYADALYDPRCHVIQAVADSGDTIATLVNYAVHPEVLGANTGICSPDMIWPMTQTIERNIGGVAMFMNSAQGGMVTADNRKADGSDSRIWAECERIGGLLGNEAVRIIQEAEFLDDTQLRVHSKRVSFPVKSPEMRAVLETSPLPYELDKEGYIATTMNLIELGNTQILTIPGEALPNIGYYLKRQMRGEHNLLFGLTNDAFGYIMTRVDWGSFKRYEYISKVSLGENTGEILIKESLKLIDQAQAKR